MNLHVYRGTRTKQRAKDLVKIYLLIDKVSLNQGFSMHFTIAGVKSAVYTGIVKKLVPLYLVKHDPKRETSCRRFKKYISISMLYFTY